MGNPRGRCALAGRTGGGSGCSIGHSSMRLLACRRLGRRAARRQGVGFALHGRVHRRRGCTGACRNTVADAIHAQKRRAVTGIGREGIVGGLQVGARLLSLRRRVPGRAKLGPARLADEALRWAAHPRKRGRPTSSTAAAAAARSALVASGARAVKVLNPAPDALHFSRKFSLRR